MDNSRMGCINRDKMDAKHPKLFDSYMEKGESFEVSERLQKPTRYANHHQSNSIMLIRVQYRGGYMARLIDKYN
jgi:hypothetical protein